MLAFGMVRSALRATACATVVLYVAHAHPVCLDKSTPVQGRSLAFCAFLNSNADGNCCSTTDDSALRTQLSAKLVGKAVSASCLDFLTQVQCAECSPWAVHLYQTSNTPTFSTTFCTQLGAACGAVTLASLGIAARCADDYYHYPGALPPAGAIGSASLSRKWSGVTLPTALVGMYPQSGTRTWWLLSKDGRLYTLPDSATATSQLQLVVDISSRVEQNDVNEQGLVGFALHPNYAVNKQFFLTYIWGSDYILSRFTQASGSDATRASEQNVLTFPIGACCIHKAGWLGFDNAGLLYWSVGEQGLFTPAQDKTSFYGKILRIDVDGRANGKQYAIPSGNPHKGNTQGYKEEIFAMGFRNPWRCRFTNGELYCINVGNGDVEGLYKVTAGTNAGWPNSENGWCRGAPGSCTNVGYAQPLFAYCHSSNGVGTQCASYSGPVIGQCISAGALYNGPDTALVGNGDYVFTDYQSGHLVRLRKNAAGQWLPTHLVPPGTSKMASDIAEDWEGNLYLIDYPNSQVFAITSGDGSSNRNPAPTPAAPTPSPPTATTYHYAGCYADQVTSRTLPTAVAAVVSGAPVAECVENCKKAGFTVAGLEYHGECWCGAGSAYASHTKLAESACNTPCTSNNAMNCGGADALSVYVIGSAPAPTPTLRAPTKAPTPKPPTTSTLTNYVGCYGDSSTSFRAMAHQMAFCSTVSPAKECRQRCGQAGYSYAGLEYHGECWCDNTYSKYGKLPASSCNTPCDSNSSKTCGGANALSVFRV